MLDPLESRVLFSSIDTSSVALDSANATAGATINKHMALVVIVHGDGMTPSMMVDTATAVQDQLSSQYQVLLLDWSQLAAAPTNAAKNGLAVGTALASIIEHSHIPVSRVNLIGFSMGGTVIGRAAEDLKSGSGEVNTIIGIDPAAGEYEPAGYAQNAKYSIAFCGNDKYGGTTGSLAADDAVLLTNLSSNALYRHANVLTEVTNMWEEDAGEITSGDQTISSLFSINSIFNDASPLPWKKNAIYSGFEAVLVSNGDDSNPVPQSLVYVNSRGHTLTVE